jgi:hypothetical protein
LPDGSRSTRAWVPSLELARGFIQLFACPPEFLLRFPQLSQIPAITSLMARKTCSCCNPWSTSWVLPAISTTYCVAVLTQLEPSLKVTTSQLAGDAAQNRRTDRCNHLSKHRSTTSEFANFLAERAHRSSVFPISSFMAEGERSA